MNLFHAAIIGQGRRGRDIRGHFFRSALTTGSRAVAAADVPADRRAGQRPLKVIDLIHAQDPLGGME